MKQIQWCLAVNVCLLTILVILIATSTDASPYLRIGPSKDLVILGVKIDTWRRYIVCNAVVGIIQATDMAITDIAVPILNFNIFNPDKQVITDFGKLELQLYAQIIWLVNALKSALLIMVTISQIDVAIIKVLSGEVASIITVRMILNKKEFRCGHPNDLEETLLDGLGG